MSQSMCLYQGLFSGLRDNSLKSRKRAERSLSYRWDILGRWVSYISDENDFSTVRWITLVECLSPLSAPK